MNSIKKFTEGIDTATFTGMGYLLWLNIKKQVFLWVFIGFIVLMSLSTITTWIRYYENSSYYQLGTIKLTVRAALIFGTLMPLAYICLFSIPGNLNALHKTTLIKRIGATRLTEQSFITIVTIWYFIISLVVVSIIFFGLAISVSLVDATGLGLLNNLFKAYIFTLFVTLLMVSVGVLFGTLNISQVLITIISVFLFVFSLLFGGFLLPITNTFGHQIPVFTKWALIINPFGFSSFSMASVLTGQYTIGTSLVAITYMLTITLLCFFISILKMNFNKVR